MSPLRRQNPREEPGALAAHAGICAGGGQQWPSLPRTVQEVCQIFARNHLHRAPVIKGELMGVVTVADILRETMWWQG